MKKPKKYQINPMCPPKTSLDLDDFEFMNSQIKEIGRDGMLHFTYKTHKDGWVAQCEEISGIVTGNNNPNPSQDEINDSIRNAIFTAFNVEPKPTKIKGKELSTMIKIESSITI
ncbi:MAG: hypothetical protein WCO09_02975 [bacterium]